VIKWDTSLVIVGPLDENNSGEWKGDKGSPGDETPEMMKNKDYQSQSQETKPTLGYAQ
jgi:hypothetical protein